MSDERHCGAAGRRGYAPGSIGADPALCGRIDDALRQAAAACRRRHPQDDPAIAAALLKRDFAIPPGRPWTALRDWPAWRAREVLNYLESLRSRG
ncbi:hypothetical protein GCM10023144_12500 [Pigmentiphaga soli]|uniref:Uncharacterized protein n=1 Tax=Pigmentiphaga soli TaxID=1007095 RepID=A0ABP8GNJ0_9BURK